MYAIRLQGWVVLVVLVFALPNWAGEPPSAKARVDLYGDPLPEGAIVRLGSVRFRHPGPVREVAFSPDGKLVAGASAGRNMVILWELATGRKVREITLGSQSGQSPTHLRFSADGKRLYACTTYGRIGSLYAWDVESGGDAKDVPALPVGMRTLGYSPDCREMILLAGETKVVRWDIDKGKELGRFPRPGKQYLNTAALVGERVLVPNFDGQAVGMWDVAQNKQLWSVKTTRHEYYPLLPMAFSADGKRFAVEAPQKEIAVYESVTGKILRRFKGDVSETYLSLSISPDARLVIGYNVGGTLHLWDLESEREQFKVPAPPSGMTDAYFSPDSKVFAAGGGNNAYAVQLWDATTGKQIDPFPGHVTPVGSVSFSPDGRMAATSSHWLNGDPVIRLWDTRTARLLRSFDPVGAGGVTVVTFSPDGETLAASHWVHWKDEKKVRTWNVRTGRELHALTGHLRRTSCLCVAYSPDGKRLASTDDYYDNQGKHGSRLCIWDATAGKVIHEIRDTNSYIRQVLFTRDGRHILAAAGTIHVYDADSGRLVGKPFPANSGAFRMALSPDGRLLATCAIEGPARLWELATRREILLEAFKVKGKGIALTPDGRTLAASDSQGNVVLFHWPSGEAVGKLSSETGAGNQVFFSPDGQRLATADNSESSVLIWDVASMVNRPLPTVPKPTEKDLRRWWETLRDDNPTEAYQAVWRFAASPEQTLPFLAASLSPIKPAEAATVARLIDDLDSKQFEVRERASRELSRLGEAVVGALQKAKSGGPPLEQRMRIERLLAELDVPTPGPEQLRATRAMAVLEQIGDPQARKILAKLATGAAGARLTQEAQAALERLKRTESRK